MVWGTHILGRPLKVNFQGKTSDRLQGGAAGIRTSLHFDRGDWAEEKQEAKSSIVAGLEMTSDHIYPFLGVWGVGRWAVSSFGNCNSEIIFNEKSGAKML